MAALNISELTTGSVTGTGVFDVLLKSVKAHLEQQFTLGRIKGPEYATVYLGSVDLAMQTGMAFVLQQRKNDLEAQLLDKQLLLAGLEVNKATIELAILTASQAKVPAELAQMAAQTAMTSQQTTNLVAESLNTPKQGALLDAQVLVATKQIDIATAEVNIKQQQVLVSQAEVGIAQAKLINIPKEGAQLDAQTAQVTQQTLNLVAEKLDTEAKTLLVGQQRTNLVAEALNIPKVGSKVDADAAISTQQRLNLIAEATLTGTKNAQASQQTTNLIAEALNIPKQGLLVDAQKSIALQQTTNLVSENLGIVAKNLLVTEQVESEALRNFIHPTDATKSGSIEKERLVLIAQECKLKAEFDLLVSNTLKSAQENLLLTQKTLTEKAQITTLGVDVDSVVGRQKSLYQAQTDGFKRDAEQKAAKLLVDTWNVRRTTDEATVPGLSPLGGVDNGLGDGNIARVINKLLSGVAA